MHKEWSDGGVGGCNGLKREGSWRLRLLVSGSLENNCVGGIRRTSSGGPKNQRSKRAFFCWTPPLSSCSGVLVSPRFWFFFVFFFFFLLEG